MKTHSSKGRISGFALVITLSLMILLTIIAVGLLSLSAVTLRSGAQYSAQAEARANARMALMLAIGALQKHAGPDQRVTAGASITGAAVNPAWTGVWRADQPGTSPAWLVSGISADPAAPLATDSSTTLLGADPSKPNSKDLSVPLMEITRDSAKAAMGWWVGDEGAKARVDLAKPKEAAKDDLARITRSQSALEPGLAGLNSEFNQLGADSVINKKTLITMETMGFATSEKDLPRRYFDDLTAGGYGLPVNVVKGRLKTDLSILFDRSQEGKPFIAEYLGATGNGASPAQTYTIGSGEKFYLSDTIRTRLPNHESDPDKGVGPNWGILWNYARLWKSVSDHQIHGMLASPVNVDIDLRTNDMLPYRKAGTGAPFNRDVQHTNSPVIPVLSHVQLGFRIKARPTGQPDRYQLEMHVKPVIGIWNPYNVFVRSRVYLFDCGFFPWLRYGTGTSSGGQVALPADTDPTGNTAAVTEIWLRDQWKFVEDTNVQGRTRLTMRTDPIDLQPGEFRLFSVPTLQNMIRESPLKPAWNEEGAYKMDLIKANGSPAVVTGTLPNGTPRYFWLGDMFLDDLQKKPPVSGETAYQRYPTLLKANSTSGWFTLKAGSGTDGASGGSAARYADFWNTGSGTPHTVPERILSGAVGGTSTIKAKYKITDLALPDGYEHLATWSFFLRPTAQIDEESADQRARGWIDANPRSLGVNPRWEGAVATDGKRQGRHLTGAFIGGAHGTGLPAKVVGDGGFGNRGLVAEAAEGGENIEPQIGDNVARYQGLGGASNTVVGGQSHVMIYDVPRTPLVSIGQFQHANLSRYSHEPGFVVGNSYADLKIPLDATSAQDFNGFTGHHISDISFEANERLWDDFYFSTIGLDYGGTSGSSFDSNYGYTGSPISLANPRMIFIPESPDTSIDSLIGAAGEKVPEVISSRIRIAGAFNVNSTSKTAWKAVLSSMAASDLPRIDPLNPGVTEWEKPKGVRFNRFGHVATADAYKKGGDGLDPSFWLGWRELDADELDKLAEGIVSEVKERGPFLSLADFVNRDPSASIIEHRRKGALQAAIDKTVNNGIPASISDRPSQKPSRPFSDAIDGESQAVGHAGYLMQGDLLQSLGPILQVRSDYFRVRAYGEARDAAGNVTAKAWCEAFVQRTPSYVDPGDAPETRVEELTRDANRNFGRRYDIVSFRWLSADEI